MNTMTVRIDARGRIVLPKAIREHLGLKEGGALILTVDGERVILRARPVSFTGALRGLHKEVWAGIDIDRWLEEERSSWD